MADDRETRRGSLPGIVRAERTTCRPGRASKRGCSPRASVASAASPSPCEPVAIARICVRGSSRARSAGPHEVVGQSQVAASSRATRACVPTLRPRSTILRPVRRAMSPSRRRRWTFDANIATTTAPRRLGRRCASSDVADVALAAGRALGVDVRRVAHEERDARVAELVEALDVEGLAVGRRVVELEVAACGRRCPRRS